MPNPYELWSFLPAKWLLFDALFDLGMITLRLGFCVTRFDPVHDVVVFAVADRPFLSSFGPFLHVCFRRVVLFYAWACSETILFKGKLALCIVT
jgi:hypothetical protein